MVFQHLLGLLNNFVHKAIRCIDLPGYSLVSRLDRADDSGWVSRSKVQEALQVLVADTERRHTLTVTQARRILGRLCHGVWDLLQLLELSPLESDPIIQLVLEEGAKLPAETNVLLDGFPRTVAQAEAIVDGSWDNLRPDVVLPYAADE